MYTIDKKQNIIKNIPEKSLTELGFKEKEHLQEWIANNPEALGEEILIIQKEFSGFSETKERLDLLGLDKQGNLVVIENKLDDSGRNVTWQVLKYASYCSNLTKSQIRIIYQEYLDSQGRNKENAEEKLVEFFDNTDFEELALNSGHTQRIIMVAGKFRKEVTSTVLWLMNYKLRIQCFKVTPYEYNSQLFLNIEQIIPMKGAEDFTIGMAEKTQEDIDSQEKLKTRHIVRKEFWIVLLEALNKNITLFKNISPSKYNWIGAGSGVRGVGFNFSITKKYGRCELYIDRGAYETNKYIFDELHKNMVTIEEEFGNSLVWERLDDKRASRIKYELNDVSVFDTNDWGKMIEFMVNGMICLEKAFKNPLMKINRRLK